PLNISRPAAHVVQIEIDAQAKRNAMSRAMMAELGDLWIDLDQDSDCRAILLTGAGDVAFCAGADIGGDLSASPETAAMVNRALLKTSAISKPIVAAVNGVCAGGGVEMLLAADIRIAASHARFGLPEVKWSIYPFGGAVVKLFRQIDHVHAMDLLLTGRLIEADEAARIGLINRVLTAEALLADALATAEAIAAHSPPAVQAVKRHIAEMIAEDAQAREAAEQAFGDAVRASSEFEEGVAAFREKRTPDYG
ncbi:MAG: enoyl-CoA hydratase-related protein, partial [Pirellulales bacterium]|nr:enoyl-CoA hydratase-related protein [Pirellulales bacterium]